MFSLSNGDHRQSEVRWKVLKMEKVFWMVGLSVLIVVGWHSPAMGQPEDMQRRQAIEAIVDQFLNSCEIKTGLKDSQSMELQRAAALAVMKKAYIKSFKGQLLDEMVAAGVEPKAYQVHYHLNSKFFDAIRPKTVAER